MECPVCHNRNPHKFYQIKGRTYCRACIHFARVFIDDTRIIHASPVSPLPVSYHLSFSLSKRQKEISLRLVSNVENKRNTLVLAVCGSGKTEISFEVIASRLRKGERVCFSVPRVALCLEMYERFNSHFSDIPIGLMYGGCEKNKDASFIICTTHQLYKFIDHPFDVLLLDEADAFPFYGDDILNEIFYACVKGVYIKMSATLSMKDIKDEDVLIMNRRYHQKDLPVPRIVKIPLCFFKMYMVYKVKCWYKEKKPILIYVPAKKYLQPLHHLLSYKMNVGYVSSDTKDIHRYVSYLRKGKLDCLITTTILERGITVTDVQVLVYKASDEIFDERTLIQIAGRVGRTSGFEEGEVLLLDNTISHDMTSCISTIRKLNQMSV